MLPSAQQLYEEEKEKRKKNQSIDSAQANSSIDKIHKISMFIVVVEVLQVLASGRAASFLTMHKFYSERWCAFVCVSSSRCELLLLLLLPFVWQLSASSHKCHHFCVFISLGFFLFLCHRHRRRCRDRCRYSICKTFSFRRYNWCNYVGRWKCIKYRDAQDHSSNTFEY